MGVIDKVSLLETHADFFGSSLSFWIQVIFFGIIISYTVIVILKINKFEVSEEDVYFKTPLMPYFPIINLVINFYLMSVLELMLWVYFAIWMSMGMFIYLSYGVWNSSEGDSTNASSSDIRKNDKDNAMMESGLTLLNHQ